MGPDRQLVHEFAEKVREVVRQDKATVDANLEWNEPSKVIPTVCRSGSRPRNGLNSQEISQALQTLLSGVSIAQFREGTETVEVVVRAVDEERLSLDRLPDLSCSPARGEQSRCHR